MRHGRTGVLGLALPPRDADPNQKPQTLTHPFPTTPHSFHCDTWSQTESTHTHTPTRTPAASSGGARGARLERGHQAGAGIVGYWHRERMMMIRPLSKLLGAGGQPNEACRALGLAAVFSFFLTITRWGSCGDSPRVGRRSAPRSFRPPGLCTNRLVGALCGVPRVGKGGAAGGAGASVLPLSQF